MTVDQEFSPDALRVLYQKDYFSGREYIDYLADKPAQQKTLRGHLNLVQRYLARGARVLEIGCAYGFFLELIREEYPRSVGVDICSDGIARAHAQGLDAREGDLLQMQFEEPFDGVCLWDTIEHLPNPFPVVRRAAGVVKPGGYLFLSTGDFGAWLPRLQGLKWRQIHPPTHLFYFTRDSLKALAKRAGLEPMGFGTVKVYRRCGSALEALARFRPDTLAGPFAKLLLRCLPRKILDGTFALDLGDTLYFVARRPEKS